MTKLQKIKLLQHALNEAEADPPLVEDGRWGPKSQGAFDSIVHGIESDDTVHACLASSFADVADIEAFRRCRAQGKSEKVCFKYGDNGIGYWGDDTSKGSGPSVALPPETMIETWGSVEDAHLKPVVVQANGNAVRAKVKDTMPHRANITNGAGIDLNPDACEVLSLVPPVMIRATWETI